MKRMSDYDLVRQMFYRRGVGNPETINELNVQEPKEIILANTLVAG